MQIARVLRSSFQSGMTLVTICSGALLAAEAGLFRRLPLHPTHAACMAELTQRAPLAQPLDNRLFVEDRKPAFKRRHLDRDRPRSHIVSQMTSPATALAIARQMVVYMRRSGSDPQLSPWLTGRNHVPSWHPPGAGCDHGRACCGLVAGAAGTRRAFERTASVAAFPGTHRHGRRQIT